MNGMQSVSKGLIYLVHSCNIKLLSIYSIIIPIIIIQNKEAIGLMAQLCV